MGYGAWVAVGAAVGALGAILGGFVERASRSRSELSATAAAWLTATEALGALAQIDVTFSEGPANRLGTALEWLSDRFEETLGKGRVELARSLVHRPMVRRVEVAVDRVWSTTYLLVLQAPVSLLREIQPHMETLDAWLKAPSDAALRKKWEEEARPAIVAAVRKHTRPLWRRILRLN